MLSTQEYKLNIHFSHFLSNFAFPGPRYDFIFKVKFLRSLAHNDEMILVISLKHSRSAWQVTFIV